MGLGTLVMAQSAAFQFENSARKKMQASTVQDATPMVNPTQYQNHVLPKATNDVEPIDLFSSLNVYTLLVQEQTCITYNDDIDAIMFTARGNTNDIGTGNDIATTVSVDGGATFAKGVSAGPNGGNNRYPSGAIYNPAGNTDPANAYKVMLAPITGGSGWLGNNFATNNWDNTALYNEFRTASSSGDMLIRGGFDVDANGICHVAGVEYTTTFSWAKGYIFKGVFDGTAGGFTYTDADMDVPFHFSSGAYDARTSANMAFSPDGSVGYAMFIGGDARAATDDLTGYQPIIYKTTDMGATWSLMSILDLKNNPVLVGSGPLPGGLWERIWPLRRTQNTAEEIFKPWFAETDIVVDHNGNLHIMALCQGTYSDYPDSLGYTYTYEKGTLFEIYNENQSDEWIVRYIDTLETRDVAAEDSGYGAGSDAVGWDMRLQASRSADGKAVFAIWTDTDSEFFSEEVNLYPDVRGWGHLVDGGLFTDVKDFTNQGATYGENYFMFVSPTAIKHSDDLWEIPISKSDIRTTNDPGQPVYHDYLKGITFERNEFIYGVGIEQMDFVNSVTAYPNPVSEALSIEVNLNKASNLNIEMTNLLGQRVYALNANGVAGKNIYTLDVNNMKSGIYFYNISANGQKTTHKVVVK
ncbi:MAG: hypothetical protein A2X11_15620 [Bacteroidetes bacterium GWE2_42_24]|nr:MAG: hypothetical protein A2X11_15620 [Bacteroidetes bacterium GWE2_42_24]OFY29292.1 MAG: hypothetical protein A2X09_06220 [Bacteroidetes bacterium GWF2_43_11]